MFASKDVSIGLQAAYPIARSVRFRSSASANLTRTFSSGNRKTWTWSGWVKRGLLANRQGLFSAGLISGTFFYHTIHFDSSDKLNVVFYPDATSTTVITTQVFRDPSAWYHIVVAFDTTQATAANRVKIYVNGVQVTAFDTATYSAQNTDGIINSTVYNSGVHNIGRFTPSDTAYLDGYMAEINFVDGAALTPSSFGAFNIYGVWQPAKYQGTYGTNGFYLNFKSFGTAAALGTDSSGNGNTWTVNNISVTAGATYDSMTDVPTLTSATVANYATLNPLSKTGQTISNGNLTFSSSAGTSGQAAAPTFAVGSSGKWYWEVQITTTPQNQTEECIGVVNDIGTPATLQRAYNSAGQYFNGTSWVAYGSAWAINDVIGIAIDVTNSEITFYKNNTSQGVKTFAWNANGNCTLRLGSSAATTYQANFGQRPFTYTPPSGFVALNTFNLSTPTIPNGAAYFAATTYTGNGTSQSISNAVNGTSFQPDFVWYKDRSVARDHALFDVTRGALDLLSSNNTGAASSVAGTLTSFNSNGYSIGSAANANGSGETYVGWQWKANGTGVSNTSGSITSTVSANITAKFSVVTYVGTGAAATVGHGLGAVPSMIIVKGRSTAGDPWAVYHSSLANTQYLYLNTTAAVATGVNLWNSTTPTSSVFSIGSAQDTNRSAGTLVAYVFAAVAGYSAFGSYTGNGSTDGPFVFLGFMPRFLMVKRTDGVSNWNMADSMRPAYNPEDKILLANSNSVELSSYPVDFTSNGFKVRNTEGGYNTNGGTYIYMAFAENPFKYSLAR